MDRSVGAEKLGGVGNRLSLLTSGCARAVQAEPTPIGQFERDLIQERTRAGLTATAVRGLRRTHTILASELTSNEDGDAPQLGALLGQIPGPLAPVIAGGTYDSEPTYCAVTERQPEPPVAVIIPPRSTAVPSAVAGTSSASQRDQHIGIERRAGSLSLRLCQPLRRQTRHQSRGADRGGACWLLYDGAVAHSRRGTSRCRPDGHQGRCDAGEAGRWLCNYCRPPDPTGTRACLQTTDVSGA